MKSWFRIAAVWLMWAVFLYFFLGLHRSQKLARNYRSTTGIVAAVNRSQHLEATIRFTAAGQPREAKIYSCDCQVGTLKTIYYHPEELTLVSGTYPRVKDYRWGPWFLASALFTTLTDLYLKGELASLAKTRTR